MFIVNCILIVVSIVYLYNFTSLINDISDGLKKKLGAKGELSKPFSCYSCMTFWSVFIYSLFTFNILFAFSIGLLGHFSARIVYKIIDKIIYLIEKIN